MQMYSKEMNKNMFFLIHCCAHHDDRGSQYSAVDKNPVLKPIW